jgi:hypothetical protein
MRHHTTDPGERAADIADHLERTEELDPRNWPRNWLDAYDIALLELAGTPETGTVAEEEDDE